MTNIKFPLTLSCGCKALSNCRCWSERGNSGRVDGDSPIDRVLREFNGAWRQTLENYGCHLPSGRNHGPCPVCGGKDRFRFDDKEGRGTWFCSQCDPQSGGGLLLLSRYLGKPTIEVANELLGNTPERSRAPVYRSFVSEDQIRKANHEQARKGAEALLASSELRTHPYMSDRGLDGQWLVNGEPIMGKNRVVIQPGELMLVPAYKAEGDGSKMVNVQKIKANKEKRPLFGGDMVAVYHKLDGHQKLIAITEGYATGVTVNRVTGAMTYVAFQTGNLASVSAWVAGQHPGVLVVFFADHDELDITHQWRPGEKFAKDAAAPIGATVALPPELGDWDDYRQAHGVEETKVAMKAAIIADRELCGVVVKPAPVQSTQAPEPEPKPTPEPVPTMPTPAPFGFTLPGAAPAQASANKRKAQPKESDLPPGIDFNGMDIDTPPGLAGRIVEYIREGANRQLIGGAYSAMALQCMAMAGAGLSGYKGVKLSLITLTLGMSAAGKEWPQKVIKELLDSHGKTVYGDIRSDKDVIRSAIYDNGHCFYVVDEAQKILASSPGSQQNKHMSNVTSTLMELATTSKYKLSQLHRDEFLSQIEAASARVEKVIEAKREAIAHMNQDHEEGRIKKAQLEIEQLERKLADHDKRAITARDGVKDPAMHLLAFSTPQKLASIVDEDSVESGFLGRALINDCGVERTKQNITFEDEGEEEECPRIVFNPQFEMLKAQIGLICQMADDEGKRSVESEFMGTPFKCRAKQDAIEDLRAILQHYDQHHYRNHPRVGAIYARFVERVLSLSSIMALGNVIMGVATIERSYVRYALMLVLQSLEHLTSNLKINEGATEETIEAKLEAVQAAILKMINIDRRKDDQDGWRYISVIKAQMKRRKFYQQIQKQLDGANQDAMQNALAMLGGKVEMDPSGKQIRLRK